MNTKEYVWRQNKDYVGGAITNLSLLTQPYLANKAILFKPKLAGVELSYNYLAQIPCPTLCLNRQEVGTRYLLFFRLKFNI